MKSETLLKTRKFAIEHREEDVPGRGHLSKDIVVHPGAVVILALLSPDEVVMIENYRFTAGKELLELPAGTLETGEQPIDCAARELEEETGYRAGKLTTLTAFYTSPGFTNEYMWAFVATDLRETQQDLDEGEHIQVRRMPLREALQATLDGRIADAKTIATLQVYDYGKTRFA
jgi:ADP-ribose pyrophosphatase